MTAPSGLTCTLSSTTSDSATFAVAVSSYGDPASESGRYIEAYLENDSKKRVARIENVTSGNITIGKTSDTILSQKLDLKGNQTYTFGAKASNTKESTTYTSSTSAYLAPPMPKKVSITSLTDTTGSSTYNKTLTIRVDFDTDNDGGAETETVYFLVNSAVVGSSVVSGSYATYTYTLNTSTSLTEVSSYVKSTHNSVDYASPTRKMSVDVAAGLSEQKLYYGDEDSESVKINALYIGGSDNKSKNIYKMYYSPSGTPSVCFKKYGTTSLTVSPVTVDLSLPFASHTVTMNFYQSVQYGVTVDWGDGSATVTSEGKRAADTVTITGDTEDFSVNQYTFKQNADQSVTYQFEMEDEVTPTFRAYRNGTLIGSGSTTSAAGFSTYGISATATGSGYTYDIYISWVQGALNPNKCTLYHTYTNAGDYTITLTPEPGCYIGLGYEDA